MKLLVPVRDTVIAKIPLPCTVRPLARPRSRVYARGVYQPLENQKELLEACHAFGALHIDEPVFVDLVVNWTPPKKPISPHAIGKKRGDVDNLAKAINDALVKARILADDHYIVGQSITKAFGPIDAAVAMIWSVCVSTEEIVSWGSPFALTNEQPSTPPLLTSQPVLFE